MITMENRIYSKNINIESTHISLKSDINIDLTQLIKKERRIIQNTINSNPLFAGYKPVPIISDETILKLMTVAGEISDTGPMSSVAGSISEVCLNYLISKGSRFSIVENGGDIALKTNRKVVIGVYAGDSSFSYNIGFKIKPRPHGYGICTSSSTGPSKSFGKTDATIVFSRQSSISDSLATCIGNYGVGDCDDDIVHNALTHAEDYHDYYDGVMVIKGEILGKTGHIPSLVKTSSKSYLGELFEIE